MGRLVATRRGGVDAPHEVVRWRLALQHDDVLIFAIYYDHVRKGNVGLQ